MNQVLAYLPNVIAAIVIFVVAAAIAGAIAAGVAKLLGDTPTGKVVAAAIPSIVMLIPRSTSDPAASTRQRGTLATGGLIALAAIIAGTPLAAILGGKAGERYHKKVDRSAYSRPGA